MAGRLLEEPDAMFDGPGLFIGRAEIKPGNARKGNRPGAHGAWLERDIQITAYQAFAAQRFGRGPENENLGVSRRIAAFDYPIAVMSKRSAVGGYDDRADRNLTANKCGSGLIQSQSHKRIVLHHLRRLAPPRRRGEP